MANKHKKIFHIICHQRNGSYNKIPVYVNRMTKCRSLTPPNSGKDFGKIGTLIHFWREWKMVQSLCKIVWQFLAKHILTIQSSSCVPWYLPKKVKNVCQFRALHSDIYSSFIHDCQNLEAMRPHVSKVNGKVD